MVYVVRLIKNETSFLILLTTTEQTRKLLDLKSDLNNSYKLYACFYADSR